MKSFQAICLQFCVTLSAPFLTCHKNVAHSHTHRQTLTVVTLETQLGSNSPASQQTLPGCQSRSKLATRQGVTLINGVALLTPTSLSVWLPFQPPSALPLSLPNSILRLFLSKTFFVCQFQERFPLSVIKCSVAIINLFRSIVDGATKLKCIDIEKLIIKKRDEEEWQNWHKERQYLALAFLLYAKFYRIVNAEIKYFRKSEQKAT